MAPAFRMLSAHAWAVPASFPRITPCHLSGRRSSSPGVMSYVRTRPRLSKSVVVGVAREPSKVVTFLFCSTRVWF